VLKVYLLKTISDAVKELGVSLKEQALTLQVRFLRERVFENRLNKTRFKVEVATLSSLQGRLIEIEKKKKKYRAVLVTLEDKLPLFTKEEFLGDVVPVLAIFAGDRDSRKAVSKILSRLGVYRGWLRQKFVKSIDDLIRQRGLDFEVLTLVYELRMYKGIMFKAGGTANFWPKGVSSIKEALEEYLHPITKVSGYYIFIKSIQFKVKYDAYTLGRYIIDRWGRLTLAPGANLEPAAELLAEIVNNAVRNYLEYTLGYRVSEISKKSIRLYFLENVKSIFIEAVSPGPIFFENVKTFLKEPALWGKDLLIFPVEIGNPRLVSMIIDKRTGSAVTLIVTYNGIRLLPSPGSRNVEPEFIDRILSMFQSLIRE